MTKYSVGFMFNCLGTEVALIRKQRPKWQAGKLNGIGGHVEEGESFAVCQAREFFEETGVQSKEEDWTQYATLRGPDFELAVFSAFTDDVYKVWTTTDEPVDTFSVLYLAHQALLSNLPWLIAAALDNEFGKNTGDLHMDVTYVQ